MKKLILAVAALALPAVAHAGPFINGSFENASVNPGSGFTNLAGGSTAITGWTVGGDSIDYIGGYWNAQNGSRSIDLSGNAPGSIFQTFDTVLGQESFDEFGDTKLKFISFYVADPALADGAGDWTFVEQRQYGGGT